MLKVSYRAAVAAALLLLPALAHAQTRGDLHDTMRRLWLEHAAWARMYIVSTSNALPDKAATTQRLMKNQTDIGTVMAFYYGSEAGGEITALLNRHITIAGDLIAAAKKPSDIKTDSLRMKWRANADECAQLLHKVNPNWSVTSMRTLMYTHLDLLEADVKHYANGDFPAEAADFDAVEKHALMMADVFSNGIVAQFPAKFRTASKGKAQ